MGDIPVAMVDYTGLTERVTYLHADHLNTPRYATDETGSLVWQWSSDAFGNGAPNQDPDGDGTAITLNLRFPGQYYDAESGLHYNWNRYYDPAIGRYITSDPIGLDGGLNTFGYVEGNPLIYSDPRGLEITNQFNPIYDWVTPIHEQSADMMLMHTYKEMQNKDVEGADQFFHCLAACRATKQSGDPEYVLRQMSVKEASDYIRGRVGLYGRRSMMTHSQMIQDMEKDMKVNEYGVGCPENINCESYCSKYIQNIPQRKRKYMKKYMDGIPGAFD